MQQGAVVLAAREIVKKFGGVVALANGQLQVRAGQITGLLGANGSGKTTLLKILAGIHQPTSGELKAGESVMTIDSPSRASQMGIGMVHQHLSLIDEMAVWKNISLGVERTNRFGFSRPERDLVSDLCADFGVAVPLDQPVKDLSPGLKQLVEILKALYRKPRILLLDEPTAALELEEVKKLFTVLRRIASDGVSMVFTSHRMWEVMEICDHVTVFRNGRFVEEIDLHEGRRDANYLVSLISGKERSEQTTAKPLFAKSGTPFAEIRNLRLPDFRYASHESIGISIYAGEIVGISGLQGQGQEDLLWALAGMLPRTVVSMDLDGAAVRIKQVRDAIHHGIFLIPGDRNREGQFNQHSIAFNLSYPQLAIEPPGFFLDGDQIRDDSLQIMSRLSIKAESEKTLVQNLSGGNQQKVVLGKWLNRKPKILLLSDPAKGIDIEAKRQLYDVIKELASEGVSVILYASDNRELVAICDRVYVMFEGKVIEELENEQICSEDLTAHSLNNKEVCHE